MYPTTNLQPGATGSEVKKLQDYLVSLGLMTQAQVNTGYGIYGPQTTAAVKTLQQQLGVDNSTGPGYWGPRTIAAVTGTKSGTTAATSGLPADQQKAVQSVYDAVVNGDEDYAERIQAAMKAASQYSDPYFKAQTRLVSDALQRGLSAKEGDLSFNLSKLRSSLGDLQKDIAASKGQLSFQHDQELQQLGRRYEQGVLTTRQNMAATGFSSSTRRARSEELLGEENTGLVESSNRRYGFQTGALENQQMRAERDTSLQIARLQELAKSGKLDLLRSTEEQIGSKALSGLGYDTLGGIGGQIPRQQTQDQLSFASSFVF